MKHFFTLILIFSITISLAQETPIERANKLIENKKYESAYKVLNQADPSNEQPDIVIAKTDLFLNYFVTSIMHQLFALTDLEPEQDIMDVRGKEGNYAMFNYTPDTVLSDLIAEYPDNYELQKQLGYYYHEVHLKYQGRWIVPDSVLVDRFKTNYLSAYENGVYDHWSAYGIGYAYLMEQNFGGSIPYFEKSVELKSDYPSSHYNLAYAYLYTNQRRKGIESARLAMDLYDYPQYKADAARMIAVMYKELDDFDHAFDFYTKADSIQPNDYYTLKPLLEIELSLNKDTYQSRTQQFFGIAPGNPTIYQDLMSAYWNAEKIDELLLFLDSQHEYYLTDNKVNGNLYFYKAVIQYDKEDFNNSKLNFEKSREIFKQVYEADHRVFDVIKSYTDEI